MKSYHTTGSLGFEQLEQRRMLSTTLDAVLEEDYLPVQADETVPELLVPGLAAPVAAGQQVPFNGSLQGLVTRAGAPPIVTVNVSATGTATLLGQFAVSIPHEVNVVTRTATGNYSFVAANGDMLTGTFIGHSTTTATPTVLAIEEAVTITGGTGRFAGAEGSFVCQRLYDTVAGTTAGSFAGTVSSPGATKQ
jgi:hypothetical protein